MATHGILPWGLELTMLPDRYDRNIRLIGEVGQRRLWSAAVAVIGVGGLGSALSQHLALMGVGSVSLADDQELDDTNRNRFVGARHDDPVPGSPKVDIIKRHIGEINPDIKVTALKAGLVTPPVFEVVKRVDWVFGCFDDDGPRFILNELCAAYAKPYIDLASDIKKGVEYGGRVCIAVNGEGCVHCLEQLDPEAVRRYLSSEEEQEIQAAIYGVPREALGETGPAVSPVNGVIASLAATEFMLAVSGASKPRRFLNYVGHLPRVTTKRKPNTECYYCGRIRGIGAAADVERYLRIPHLQTGRAKWQSRDGVDRGMAQA